MKKSALRGIVPGVGPLMNYVPVRTIDATPYEKVVMYLWTCNLHVHLTLVLTFPLSFPLVVTSENNCFWIFLQSVFINAVSDFRVGPDDVTSATCDEALCGVRFCLWFYCLYLS
jgi:hypothetical protein